MFLSTNGFTLVRFQIIHIQPLKFIRFALEYNLQLITFVTIYMVQNVRLVTRSSRFLFSFNFNSYMYSRFTPRFWFRLFDGFDRQYFIFRQHNPMFIWIFSLSSSLVSKRKNNNCKRHLHRQSSNTSAKTNSLLFFQISFICYKEKTIDEIRWYVPKGMDWTKILTPHGVC